ncbi:hypothetical protein Rsub_08088 [Raphidocelis subcapitata]|uniref:Glutaredoxin domain-containing protein n=1 Tax=Raphidocelis subcapitata TaxID=307507 RepID=A0A2V0PFY0_9CHLO|nr:hypothetical protein Rsub_08088 [Raphidocelis subcapitata]|eukprot:GBF95965.1 hypothetical protein Rsub_08088 [Raphidocelis subcapitata]
MATERALSDCAAQGASLEEQIDGAIESHGVVLFAKSWCPYSIAAADLFRSKGVNIDQHSQGAKIHDVLKAKTNQKTVALLGFDVPTGVPYVYVNREFLGGCDATKALDAAGDLDRRLGPLLASSEAARAPRLVITVEAASASDLAGHGAPGAGVEEQIEGAVAALPVAVFGKSWCPYTIAVIDLLKSKGSPFVAFQIDAMPNGAAVHEALKAKTGQKTVPYVWINHEFVGGCDATKALDAAGGLDGRLAAAAGDGGGQAGLAPRDVQVPPAFVPAACPDAPPVYHCLLNFPDTVDTNVIRLVAVFVFVVSVFAVAFRHSLGMKWACWSLFVDFCLRFTGGAQASPLGSLAILLLARKKPELSAGFPKQFAVGVGVVFTLLGAVLYWTDTRDDNIAGLVFWACLILFAGLEGFLGFCAGCWVFGQAITLGIIPRTVYSIHIDHKGEVEYQWDWNMRRVDPKTIPQPKPASFPWPGSRPCRTDLALKLPKTDDYRRQDFHLIKHMKIGVFTASLSVTGLALLWKSLARGFAADPRIWQALAIVAAALYVFCCTLYLLKLAIHPRKAGCVKKEYDHPVHGGAISLPFIILVMFAQLAHSNPECGPNCNVLAKARACVLFWMGAAPMLALAVMRVGDMLATTRDQEHVAPSWLMPPVGLLLGALIGPKVAPEYAEAMHFWYAFAFTMLVVLLVLTWQKAMVNHILDCRQHPMLYIWVAAPSVACSAYLSLRSAAQGAPYAFDFFARILLFCALSTWLFLGWGFVRKFFGSCCFAMTEWAYGFPFVALAIALLNYHESIKGAFTEGLAYLALAWATLNIFLIGCHTLTGILRGGVFRDPGDWGPALAVQAIDEALIAYLEKLPKVLGPLEGPDAAGIARFIAGWKPFEAVAYHHLVVNKNGTVFPEASRLAAGAVDKYVGLNTRHADKLAAFHKTLSKLAASPSPAERGALLDELRKAALPWAAALAAQLLEERDVVGGVFSKLASITAQRRIVNKARADSPLAR